MKVKTLAKQIAYGYRVIFHPFDGFWDIKHEKRGSMAAAVVLVVLLLAVTLFDYQFKGFLFMEDKLRMRVSLITEILKIGLPFILWVFASWSLTTLLDGEGSLKDIAIATAYCLLPMILIKVPMTLASNFVTVDEGAFITVFNGISYFWAGLLLFISVVVTHQYTVPKAILTILMSVVCMGILLFLSMLVVTLAQQIVSFFMMVYQEASIRFQ
jgi:hypothetical protein